MKIVKLFTSLAAFALIAPAASAADQLSLTFNRTGSNAGSVSVIAAGVDGVQASLVSVSHSLKTTVNSAVLCPDVNGNASPNITFELTVSGLPAGFSYDNVGLDIHALNASGDYQNHNDGKPRQWNVNIQTGTSATTLADFASKGDIDIAAGVNPESNDRHQMWNFTAGSSVTGTDPLTIRITVTKGATNEGCFFGLSSVSLSTGESTEPEPVEPPVEPDPEKNIYTIKWKNNTSSYMAEMAGGGIEIVNYATTARIFWELVPTEKANCYYLRNCATGNYIGSCNYTPSSASRISMSATPVEYYMGTSASTSGDNKGCVWFSSTDCANYNKESSGARCLNKDGASSNIITWTTGVSNVGSYWTITPSANLYEPQPFIPAASIGNATAYYQILNLAGQALTHSLAWEGRSKDSSQKWYFVGVSNTAGGYQIVDASNNTPINGGTRYKLAEHDGSFTFTAADGDAVLTLGGESAFRFASVAADRTPTSLMLGLYSMPCGSLSNVWFTKVESGCFHYPMPTMSNGAINYPTASKPANKYTIVTLDELNYGSEVTVTLNMDPTDDMMAAVYFDWDCDGVFEEMQELTMARQMTFTVGRHDEKSSLPERTRMRLKVTTNGLLDADDEVVGHVMDFKVNCAASEAHLPTVGVNAANRGTATVDAANKQAIATPKGTSAFVCWKEGYTFISTQSTMAVEES
ncbi:MAG: hypothetical protein K2M97_03025, partial [Muribaculaceae bacterium]|nr:hypothetical protein [Muribaculaceae bacterium]